MLGLAFAEGGDDVDHDESGIGHGLEGPVFQECLGLEAAKEALAEHIVVAISGRANALAQSSRLDSGAEEAAGALAAPAGVMDGADADDSACRGAPQGGQQEDAGPEGAGDCLSGTAHERESMTR